MKPGQMLWVVAAAAIAFAGLFFFSSHSRSRPAAAAAQKAAPMQDRESDRDAHEAPGPRTGPLARVPLE